MVRKREPSFLETSERRQGKPRSKLNESQCMCSLIAFVPRCEQDRVGNIFYLEVCPRLPLLGVSHVAGLESKL